MKPSNHYHRLSKKERLVLFLRAVMRDDKTDIKKIIAASPRDKTEPIDLRAGLYALHLLHLLHLAFLLDLLVCIVLLKWTMDDSKDNTLVVLLGLFARQYVEADKAWQLLSEEKGLDPNIVSLASSAAFKSFANHILLRWVKKCAFTDEDYELFSKLSDERLPRLKYADEVKQDYLTILRDYENGLS